MAPSEWEPSWPDPCPRCGQSTVHELRPVRRKDVLYTSRTCAKCGGEWETEAPRDLGTDTIVRAYCEDETAVDLVDEVDGDQVKVAGRVVERWQVVIY